MVSIDQLSISDLALAILSILPWGIILFLLHPQKLSKKWFLVIFSLFLGYVSTRIILGLHPIIWPEVDFKPKKTSLLTATVHLAFIQAGMMEETFKIFLILCFGYFQAFRKNLKMWSKDIVLIGGFVALGFALTENYTYIHKEVQNKFPMFTGRLLYSSNIHLLINLCFSLFLIKSNDLVPEEKFGYLLGAFFLAVVQHGVVDFFLIPSSKFGILLSVAMFIGIWVWVVRDLRKYVYFQETVLHVESGPYYLMKPETEDDEVKTISG